MNSKKINSAREFDEASNKAFDEAFDEACEVGALEEELEELMRLKPSDVNAFRYQKEEAEKLRQKIDSIKSRNDKKFSQNSNADEKSSGESLPKRRDKQIEHILEVIKEEGFPPFSIPYGGKNKVKERCLKSSLFTSAGFDHTWKELRKRGLVEVENIEIYRRK